MYFLGYFARRRTSSFYPTAQSLRLGTFFPYWDDLLTPYPGSMFLLLGFFLPQEVEQIVRIGLPPGYTYEPCIQFPEEMCIRDSIYSKRNRSAGYMPKSY